MSWKNINTKSHFRLINFPKYYKLKKRLHFAILLSHMIEKYESNRLINISIPNPTIVRSIFNSTNRLTKKNILTSLNKYHKKRRKDRKSSRKRNYNINSTNCCSSTSIKIYSAKKKTNKIKVRLQLKLIFWFS